MKHFPQRLKMARKMNGWSLQELANRMDNKISKQAISRYENGEMIPERDTFLLLLQALKLKEEFFHRGEIRIDLEPSFRKLKDLPKQRQEAIVERTKDYLERYLETESIVASETRFHYQSEIICSTMEDAESEANQFRKSNNLGNDPIYNLSELIEDLGIKVYQEKFEDDRISGLSAWVSKTEGIAVIYINTSHPVDRRRFTLAHELAHLVMNFPDDYTNKKIEKLCNRFAAALLIPKEQLVRELGPKRKSIHMKELKLIKAQYGISVQSLLRRANDLGIISDHTLRKKFEYLTLLDLRRKSIGLYSGVEEANQLLQLLCRGISEGSLSMAKAASLNGERVAKFRETINAI